MELKHHGIKGQKWGIRRYQNEDGSLTEEGKKRRSQRVFVSGSSKTQDNTSNYFRELPDEVKGVLKDYMNKKVKFLVGDAPGIDRQVQDFLKENNYKHVTVYGPGTQIRYKSNPDWKHKLYNSKYEPGSSEWLAKKDKAMQRSATEGLAITLDEGSKATKENVRVLKERNKPVKVFQLSKKGKEYDSWIN